jgi:hypothetical protein
MNQLNLPYSLLRNEVKKLPKTKKSLLWSLGEKTFSRPLIVNPCEHKAFIYTFV